MATKTEKKATNIKSMNTSLVNATTSAINATVENGEKWQKLTMKLIKKSEPIRRKQMNMVFDTAEAVRNQVVSGTERAMDLVEFEQAVKFAKNNPVSQKVMEVAEGIQTKVNENPIVQQLSRTSETLKTKGTARLNDIKEDVMEQAQSILNKGEKMVEGALSTKKGEETKKPAKAATKTKTMVTNAKPATKAVAKKRTTKPAVTKSATKAVTTTTAPKAKAPVVNATPAKVEAPEVKEADNK